MPLPDHVTPKDFDDTPVIHECSECRLSIAEDKCLTLFPDDYEHEVFCDQSCHDTYVIKHAVKVVQDFFERLANK